MKLVVTFGDNDYRTVFYTLKQLLDDYVIKEQFDTEEQLRERVKRLLEMAVELEYSDIEYIQEGTKIFIGEDLGEYIRGCYPSVYLETDLEDVSNLYIS